MESLANVAAWTTCPHCNSKLSAAAFAKHEARCKMRADVQAERDGLLALQKLEGAKPKPQPSWPQCTNCGERYGPLQLLAHTKRCTKLLPHGANGFGPQDHARNQQFAHLYTKAAKIVAPRGGKPSAPPSLADTVNSSLKNWGKSMGDLLSALGPKIDKDTLERLRKLFDRFDVNHDKLLSIDEFGVLMRNCFPTRVADANQIVAEFRTFDVDGSGSIDFDEFTRRYLQMRQAVDPRYDEACAMFDFFDADGSGTLDPDEFLCLLNQVFPDHCDENEERAVTTFPEADTDGSGGISFPEFIAYFDVLRGLYNDDDDAHTSSSAPSLSATALAQELVVCACGQAFLPSVLPQHQRVCVAVRSNKAQVTFMEEAEQDPYSSDPPPPPRQRSRSSVEFGDNQANTFVPCEWCGRTFFPDRLEVHLRVCKQRLDAERNSSGIRPTAVDGRDATVGLYSTSKARMVAGLALNADGNSVMGYSPQVAMAVAEEEAREAERVRIETEAAARLAAERAAAAKKAREEAEFNERQSMLKHGWVA